MKKSVHNIPLFKISKQIFKNIIVTIYKFDEAKGEGGGGLNPYRCHGKF